MKYPAQIQAAIEILKDMATNHRPADRVIAYYFKQNRYIGGKDKKVISDAVYGVLRQRGFLDWALAGVGVPVKPRTRVAAWLLLVERLQDLREVFNGEKHAPQKLWRTEKPLIDIKKFVSQNKSNMPFEARFNIPAWLEPLLQQTFPDDLAKFAGAMAEKASADVRVNTLKTTSDDLVKVLTDEGYAFDKAPFVATSVRLQEPKNLFNLKAFKDGLFEVQDSGSQLIAALSGVMPGDKTTDFCAGAGGKTLALAALMENKGILTAGDIIPPKVAEMKKRLKRAGVDNAVLHTWSSEADQWVKRHKGTQDVVLLDVPCSGSGVWRRNPDAKWNLTQADLQELCAIQARILQSASRLVKKGGRLVYATCSVLPPENRQQIEAFISERNGFKIVPMVAAWQEAAEKGRVTGTCPTDGGTLQLSPHKTETDGFFVAILERTTGTD